MELAIIMYLCEKHVHARFRYDIMSPFRKVIFALFDPLN